MAEGRDPGGGLFAAGFILVGAWALYETREMSPLGAVFPKTIASAMIVFALVSLVRSLLRPREVEQRGAGESNLRRALLVGLMVSWVALVPVLGFATASLLAFCLIAVIANHDPWSARRVLAYGITAVSVVTGFHALFAWALRVPLPQGLLI